MPQGPLAAYLALLECGRLEPDPAQASAVSRLQALYTLLDDAASERGIKAWVKRLRQIESSTAKGLYLWGGIGRGKTTLMDLFYDCLPFGSKRRTHFHRFMHK